MPLVLKTLQEPPLSLNMQEVIDTFGKIGASIGSTDRLATRFCKINVTETKFDNESAKFRKTRHECLDHQKIVAECKFYEQEARRRSTFDMGAS